MKRYYLVTLEMDSDIITYDDVASDAVDIIFQFLRLLSLFHGLYISVYLS